VTQPTSGRRNAEQIRAALIESARKQFSANAYDRVSVRDIAAKAGLQASLINRHFGSKASLFREVLLSLAVAHPRDPDGTKAKDHLGAGESSPAYVGRNQESADLFSIVAHSGGSAEAQQIVAKDLEDRFITPLAQTIPSADREIRASLIFATLMGIQLIRDTIRARPLVDVPNAEIMAIIEPLLEALHKPDRARTEPGGPPGG
jgi:AcrR family transcriptional regulator